MIVFKIDKTSHTTASSQIKDMSAVLEEIATSLELLQSALDEHERAISTPTIDDFRGVLQQMTANGVTLTRRIYEYSQQLCAVSDQATKHLVALDEHSGAALRDKSTTPVNYARTTTQVQ